MGQAAAGAVGAGGGGRKEEASRRHNWAKRSGSTSGRRHICACHGILLARSINASHLENSTPGSQRRRSSRFHERVGSAGQRRGGGSGRRLCGHGCSGAAGALARAAHRAWQVAKVAARVAWGETWGWLGSCVSERQVGRPDVGASLLPQPPAGSRPLLDTCGVQCDTKALARSHGAASPLQPPHGRCRAARAGLTAR